MVADQIRLAVQGRKLVKKSTGDVLGTITISIGVAQFGRTAKAEAVIRRADACLYGAKQQWPQSGDRRKRPAHGCSTQPDFLYYPHLSANAGKPAGGHLPRHRLRHAGEESRSLQRTP